jgi:acyl-CoA dehydrogenase
MLKFSDSDAAAELTEQARIEVSNAGRFTALVNGRAVDTALQYCGANGIGKDLPLADFSETLRTFRLVDGADAVHLQTIARAAFEDVDESELESLLGYGESVTRAPAPPSSA